MVFFPDLKKAAANAQKKLDSLKEKGASEEAVKEAELKAAVAEEAYRLDEARKNVIATSSTADSKATVWAAMKARLEKMKENKAADEEISSMEAGVEQQYQVALEAAIKRDEAIAENEKTIAEVEAARAARA